MSDPRAIIMKHVEILCRVPSGMRDETVDGLLDVMHWMGFELNVLREEIHELKGCLELTQHRREPMILTIEFEKSRF